VTDSLCEGFPAAILIDDLAAMELAMVFRVLAILVLSASVQADELDAPPAMDEDPRCLARKVAQEAYLRSIADFPVSKGKPCPPNPETVRQRELACHTEKSGSRIWEFISDGFVSGSSMLSKGVPYVVEELGEPLREEKDEGFWDIDIYEIPRTLYFPGVTVVTRDFVDDAVNFDLEAAEVKTGNGIYEMRVESGDFQFAYGLTLDSSREDVEASFGLPCGMVGRLGRTAVRSLERYGYAGMERYSVTFNFDDDGRVEYIHWYYDSVWH
jgi:hypothetical protein